ncbi:MAG: ribosome silencing factor [Lentisphaerae bacterium]|nr:ribosome silencing factor [Lentisphaerota bacterium]
MKKAPPSPTSSPAKKAPARKSPAKQPAARKTAAPKTPRAKTPADPLRGLVDRMCTALDDKKGEHIVVLNVAGLSSVTDYMILCSGLNIPHLRALADEVARRLRLEDPPVACHRRAGSAESEWFVLDYVDVVIHLFTPAMRTYYALEQLWKDAPVLS